MSQLSEKNLLNKMKEFPHHELTEYQKQETIKKIRNVQKKWEWPIQKIGVFAALVAVLLLVPLISPFHTTPVPEKKSAFPPIEKEKAVYFGVENGKNGLTGMDTNFGIPGKVSIMAPKEWIAKDYRGVSKLMVFAWGKELDEKTMVIRGLHMASGENLELANIKLGGKLYNADSHAITSFPPFPKPGKWTLDFKVSGRKFAKFTIYVKEPYVKIGKSTLRISKEDLVAGTYSHLELEVEGSYHPQKLVVKLYNQNDHNEFVFTNPTEYTIAFDNKKITVYSGDVSLLNSGKYTMEILGEKGTVQVK